MPIDGVCLRPDEAPRTCSSRHCKDDGAYGRFDNERSGWSGRIDRQASADPCSSKSSRWRHGMCVRGELDLFGFVEDFDPSGSPCQSEVAGQSAARWIC